jgi:hypothetical protein
MKKTQKTSKDDGKAWNKWVFIGIAVMFAVAMVATYLAPLFDTRQTAQIGNTAVIGYTIRDESGYPLISTDQQLVQNELQSGNLVFLTSGMEIPIGAAVSVENNVAVIPIVYPQIEGFAGFALLGFEINSISAGLIGMRSGETRTIGLNYGGNNFTMSLDEEQATGIGINFTETMVGDQVPLGLTTSPNIPTDNSTDEAPALRIGTITQKTEDELVIRYRYGSADITLNGLSSGW